MRTTDKVFNWIEEFSHGARILFAVCVVAFAGAVTEYIVVLNQEHTIDREHTVAVEQLATIRARIEGEIFSTLHLSRGMIGFVATHPDLTWDDFESLAVEIAAVGRHVRNIALAPDNVIQFMYPVVGNERAIGLDYRKHKKQWPAVQRAIELGNTIVAGPVKLVQGGQGFVARTPIYVQNRNPSPGVTPKYWGLASVVLDAPSLFKAAGMGNTVGSLNVAIRGMDGLGDMGGMVFGDPELFEQDDVVLQSVSLPNGWWQMGAVPTQGWGATGGGEYVFVRLTGWGIAVAFGVLVFSLLSLEQRNRALALHDPLTTLPNRRLMYDRLTQLAALSDRSGMGFTLMYLDLNGFKSINDEYGHHIGDQVLIETGERLLALTRRSDTVARMGGDEFVIILPGVTDQPTLDNVLVKLHQGIGQPMKLGDAEISVGASVGYARFPEDAEDIGRLVNIADKKMYRDKTSNVADLHVVARDG